MSWEDIFEKAYKIVNFIIADKKLDSDSTDDFPDIDESYYVEKLKDSDYLYNRILQREEYDHNRAFLRFCHHIRLRRVVKYLVSAAAASILIGIFLFSGNQILRKPSIENVVVVEYPEIKPGVKKAMLVLADGTKMDLGKVDSLVVEDNGVFINIDSTGIKYEESNMVPQKEIEVAYNTLEVPRGGEFFTTLSDGTKVWLNSDSKLKYPVTFSGDNRLVYLEGEAYFEVTKNSSKSFTVRALMGDVIVHGTEFNVKGYPDEACLYTTLVKGSVEFKESGQESGVSLFPGQQLSYNSKTRSTILQQVNVNNFISWKDKLLQFEEQTLEDIMNILSRWYDVNILYESEGLKEIQFSGRLDKYKNIGSFLKLFEAGGNIEFEVKNKNILIKRKTSISN